jgi:CHAD domain-containing protein
MKRTLGRKPISSYAAKETSVRFNRFSRNVRHGAKDPEDPDAIHDLRVSIRRLVQACKTFGELLDPAPVKHLRRRLRKLMDLCAAVRNCDVALTLLGEAGATTDASASRLKKMRGQAAEKLHRYLKKERPKRRPAPGARSHPKDRDWKLDQSLERNLSRILPVLAEEFFASGTAALSAPADYHQLHQFRLQAKRFRYTLELFESFYGTEMPKGAGILKELQDRLGAINDCATTITILERDQRAVAAIGKLLRKRKTALEEYARRQFVPQKLDWWKHWLAEPARRPA